ncbi:MAG: NAD(P)H-dependent oxidoreductase [Gammaproteobacteria bacterium]|nr:NAD(P)H-dependent oxidoreductase [Gammaproteobacteria bacterium]
MFLDAPGARAEGASGTAHLNAPVILALSGSQRRDSYNARLLRAASVGAQRGGATVGFIDWEAYPLPLFDPEVEDAALPDTVLAFRARLAASRGLLIACPEYNASVTPLLKNAIDWASRQAPGAPGPCFSGGVVALLSASTSRLGGVRGLDHLRDILSSVGALVLPDQFALVQAQHAFGEDGRLRDQRQQAAAEAVARRLAEVVRFWR